jgi:hypothetical protein
MARSLRNDVTDLPDGSQVRVQIWDTGHVEVDRRRNRAETWMPKPLYDDLTSALHGDEQTDPYAAGRLS